MDACELQFGNYSTACLQRWWARSTCRNRGWSNPLHNAGLRDYYNTLSVVGVKYHMRRTKERAQAPEPSHSDAMACNGQCERLGACVHSSDYTLMGFRCSPQWKQRGQQRGPRGDSVPREMVDGV